MYGAEFGDSYEDELYRDNPSGEDTGDSDAIDSDTEEKILSHIYYQSSTATPKAAEALAPKRRLKSPLERTQSETDDDSDYSESKYQIEKKRRRRRQRQCTASDLTDISNPSKATSGNDKDSEYSDSGDQSISVTVVRPFRSATLSDEEHGIPVDMRDVSFNTHDDMAVDSYLDSVTSTGLVTPARNSDEGAAMEHHHIQIDALQLTSPPALEHAVLMRRADADPDVDADDEYGYLDEVEFQGRNRYFMEEKEIICRKCHRPGHIAKECTTVTCTVCGKDGHTSKDCKMTGNVCHACNMRGHVSSECPQRSNSGSSQQRSRLCDRCNSRSHHTEECATIWRRYVYAGSRAPQYLDVTAWCYNCASRGHFGDDCQRSAATGSLAFQGDTAFGAVNCPGNMINVSNPRQQQSHSSQYDSSSGGDRQHSSPAGRQYSRSSGRQYSSSSGHQNREERRREHGFGPRRSYDPRGGNANAHGNGGSRHRQGSSGGPASRRPDRSYNNHNGGGYHHTPQHSAVKGQHRRY
ncbi:hypothetical protein GGI21_000982 [Coemansia aciculifera]|uniref:Uncharacterized protein n=1 Tax=Coemansia aciculifera TaxID=417176 RepID=A0ACC1M8N3_9FUNG|nr:hypothetical protein IWW38_000900 [Coemansia aciculifera]KAJ2910334.1 hypothetical protein GGI21_000982 [Coemansia aciculifera]